MRFVVYTWRKTLRREKEFAVIWSLFVSDPDLCHDVKERLGWRELLSNGQSDIKGFGTVSCHRRVTIVTYNRTRSNWAVSPAVRNNIYKVNGKLPADRAFHTPPAHHGCDLPLL